MFDRVRASILYEVNYYKQRLMRQALFGAVAAVCGLMGLGFGLAAAFIALERAIGSLDAALVFAGVLLLAAVGCGLAMSGGEEPRPVNLAQDFREDLSDEVRFLGDQARAQVQAVGAYATTTARDTVQDVATQVSGIARDTVHEMASEVTNAARSTVDQVTAKVTGAARSTVEDAAATVDGLVRSVARELPAPVREAFLYGTRRALPRMQAWQLAAVAAAAGFVYARRVYRRRHR